MRFLEDNLHLVSGSLDRMLIVWHVGTGNRVQQIYTHAPALHMQLSPDNSYLAILAKADQGNKSFLFEVKMK